MKILVVGASGQVARSLAERAAATGVNLQTTGRPRIDLTDRESVETALTAARADLIINAAAYTAVDQAETDEGAARALNAVGPGVLAAAAARTGAPIIHLSTDYVFDGSKDAPYVEEDATAPLGAYGRTKLEGEAAVAAANRRCLIIRTAWVYSPFGKNFVKTMLRVAQERETLNVVADQLGAPTYAIDIADALLALAPALTGADAAYGVYHMTGGGEATWADFAEEIFRTSRVLGGPSATVNRITTEEYPTPAARPANSRLDCSKLERDYGCALPDWRSGARRCVTRLIETGDWKT